MFSKLLFFRSHVLHACVNIEIFNGCFLEDSPKRHYLAIRHYFSCVVYLEHILTDANVVAHAIINTVRIKTNSQIGRAKLPAFLTFKKTREI